MIWGVGFAALMKGCFSSSAAVGRCAGSFCRHRCTKLCVDNAKGDRKDSEACTKGNTGKHEVGSYHHAQQISDKARMQLQVMEHLCALQT